MKATICGIYVIKCSISTDRQYVYVGSSKSISIRWKDHKSALRGNYHHNMWLNRLWNKYGESVFSFELLETVEMSNLLNNREQWWIDYYVDCIGKKCVINTAFSVASRSGLVNSLSHNEASARGHRQQQWKDLPMYVSWHKHNKCFIVRYKRKQVGGFHSVDEAVFWLDLIKMYGVDRVKEMIRK